MAPKKSEAVIVTPQTILNGLSGDAAQQLVALTQLSAPAAAAFSQVEGLRASSCNSKRFCPLITCCSVLVGRPYRLRITPQTRQLAASAGQVCEAPVM